MATKHDARRPARLPGDVRELLGIALWSFRAAYALHVAEEAPGFVSWARSNASPSYSRADFARVNASGLLTTVATTWLAARGPRGFALHHASITQKAVWNPVFHLATRAPGFATAAGAVLPARAPAHAAAVWSTVYR